MAAPTLQAQGSLGISTSGTTITPTIPTHQADDILVVIYHTNADAATFSTPSGWTAIGTVLDGGTRGNGMAFWKRAASGSETNPQTTTNITFSSTSGGYGRVYVIRGAETSGDPWDNTATAVGNTASPDAPSITTTGADRLVFYAISIDDDNTFSTGFPPTGYTAGTHLTTTSGGDHASDNIRKNVASAGTENPATFTQSASDPWLIWGFAFKPPAGSSQNVSATGLGSAQAFGTVKANIAFSVTGLGSAGAFGTVTAAPGGVTRTMSGLGSAGDFGTPSVIGGSLNVDVAGLGSAASFGAPTALPGTVNVSVAGLGSAQAFGSAATAPGNVNVVVAGVSSAGQFGAVGASGGSVSTFDPAVHGGKFR